MEIAALILSLIAILMSGSVLVIFLAKNVFSSHTIQMVPVDSVTNPNSARPIEDDLKEFDVPSAMDLAIHQTLKNKSH